jgi:hypothetical protein
MDAKQPEINKDTLEFIFEYIKDAPEAQLKDVEALDNKVIQILSVSSLIIGLIGFVIGKSGINFPALLVLFLGLLAYVALAVTAFIHLKSANFRRSFQADVLWKTFWADDVGAVKQSLVDDIGETYAFNKGLINKKAKTLLFVVIFAAIEVVAVGSFVICAALS